jgi:hypothetical protein
MIARRILTVAVEAPGQAGKEAGKAAIRVNAKDTSSMSSSPSPKRCSSYQIAAARSSARASGCSSTRTTLLKLVLELGSCAAPLDRLDLPLGDLARSAFQLGRPCPRDFLVVGFFQAREQLFRDPRPILARELEHLREKFFGRHTCSLSQFRAARPRVRAQSGRRAPTEAAVRARPPRARHLTDHDQLIRPAPP